MAIDSVAILRHGVRSVWRNAGASLAICWPWLVVFAVVFGTLYFIVKQSGFGTTPLEPERGAGAFAMSYLIGIAVYLIGFSSIAVNWHRYILLDEFPGVAQRLRLDESVWRYAGRLILAGLLTAAILIVPVMIVMVIASGMFSTAQVEGGLPEFSVGTIVLIFCALVVVATFATAIVFRFGLALPAAAVGRREIKLFDSWRLTRGLFGGLLILAAGAVVLQVVCQLLIDGISYVVKMASPIAGIGVSVILGIAITWFFTFLGITLLTTLYGHLVEKRPL